VFAALKASGYDKAIGLEYFPLEDPEEGLKSLFAQLSL
jgi:hydroxypyruvate isomerase